MTVRWTVTPLLILVTTAGCSRGHCRRGADAETYSILSEKADCRPWELPPDFTIQKDSRSRLSDPPDLDCPPLPDPNPRLHTYELPATRRSDAALTPKPNAPQAEAGTALPIAHAPEEAVILLTSADLSIRVALRAPNTPVSKSPQAAPV